MEVIIMHASTGPFLLQGSVWFFGFFFSSRPPKGISQLFHTSCVFSHTRWDAQETCEFVRPDKLWKGTSGVLIILMLGFYCM